MILSERTATAKALTRAAMILVPQGSTWLHKKGGVYMVVGHDLDTDTGTIRIRYQRIDGPDYSRAQEAGLYYSRPLEQWTPDRFTLLSDSGTRRSHSE